MSIRQGTKIIAGSFSDYTNIENKPKINNVTLEGNKTSDELSLQSKLVAGEGISISDTNEISVTALGGVTSVNGQTGKVTIDGLPNQNNPEQDIKMWLGTTEEYEAIETKDPATIYYANTMGDPNDLAYGGYIGQIIQVTCTDSYIPDGTLPCNGTEYDKGIFKNFWDKYLVANITAETTETLYAFGERQTTRALDPGGNDAFLIFVKDSIITENTKFYDENGQELSNISLYEQMSPPPITVTNNTFIRIAQDSVSYGMNRNVAEDKVITKQTFVSKLQTCTYEEYTTDINTYGFCEKIAVNTTNNKFKTPTLTNTLYQGVNTTTPVIGNGMTIGLTDGSNLTGLSFNATNNVALGGGADLYGKPVGTTLSANAGLANASTGLTTDPTKSGIIADTSSLVKEASVKYFLVVADGATNASTVDWSELINTLNNKVNKNLDNSTTITNCLTEIPQDIKLELTDGNLVLKAGSKIYIPNGFETEGTTPKFDTVIVPTDTSFHSGTIGDATMKMMLCCNTTGGFGVRAYLDAYVSGSTDSIAGGNEHIWYDTTTNIIKYYTTTGAAATDYTQVSLPIGIYQRTTGIATSIDQIFNGIGYIGSTIFATPGVKGLAPNGRNEDGTLNNILFTTSTVSTHTSINTYEGNIAFNNTDISYVVASSYTDYDSENNYNLNPDGNRINYGWCGTFTKSTDGKFTNFKPNTTIQLLDRNDKEEIVDWNIPDYSAGISISFPTDANPFVAPSKGIAVLYVPEIEAKVCTLYINGKASAFRINGTTEKRDLTSISVPLDKKWTIAFDTNSSGGSYYGEFYPLKGVN